MTATVSVLSPANIAFVKHWGLSDDDDELPLTGSLSMNMDCCLTHTSVAFYDSEDEISFLSESGQLRRMDAAESDRNAAAYLHLKRMKAHFDEKRGLKVVTKNNFPSDAGLASSASGFSALTASVLTLLDGEFPPHELLVDMTAKAGSYSAVRSLVDHFGLLELGSDKLELKRVNTELELVDLIVLLNPEKKEHSSLDGHPLSKTSPFYEARLQKTPKNLDTALACLEKNNAKGLFEVTSQESLLMHSVMMTSQPALFYWSPETFALLKALEGLKGRLDFGVTVDAGPNVHLICLEQNLPALKDFVFGFLTEQKIKFDFMEARSCQGTRQVDFHLF